MKKILTNLFARTGRVIAMTAIALAPVAVSCVDELSGDLEDRVDQLENRVTELESQMAEQIEALQGLAGGSTVVSCTLDEETGIYTIAFSDGSIIEVNEACESSSVVGVTEQDGKYYWTIGGEPMMDAGEMVPVSVTPGIRVNPETNIWEVSPDGETWLATGIVASEGASIFAKVDDDEDFVYFTLADGSQLKVAKEKDFICSPLSGKQYFKAGEMKSVKLDMSDVKKSAVLAKPDGWKASIENDNLAITAPAESDASAETSGVITILAVSGSGEVILADLYVAVDTAPHEIIIDAAQNITITVDPDLIEGFNNFTNDWGGYYYAGACKLSEFSPESIVEQLNANTRPITYSEELKTSLADLLGSEPEETSYVVWCLDRYYVDAWSGEEKALDVKDMLFESIINVEVSFEVSDITFEDAHISVSVKGADSYFAAVIPQIEYNLENIIANLGFGDSYTVMNSNYSGSLTEYGMLSDWMGEVPNEISSGTTYIAIAVPVLDGVTEYTEADIYTQTIEIPAITLGGTMDVTVGEVRADLTSVETEISASEGTYKVFVNYLADDEAGKYADDEALLEYLVSSGKEVESADLPYTYKKSSLDPGAKGSIIAVAVDRSGKAGAIAKQTANTSELTFNDIGLAVTLGSTGIGDASISVAGEGIVSYRYFNLSESQQYVAPYGSGSGRDDEGIENMLAIGTYYSIRTIYESAVTDGNAVLEFSGLAPTEKYTLFIVGIDASGVPTKMATLDYTPGITPDKFVAKDSERWTSMSAQAPKITGITIGEEAVSEMKALPDDSGLGVKFTVEAGTECARYWVAVYNSELIVNGGIARSNTANFIDSYRTREYVGDTGEIDHTTDPDVSTIYPYNRGYEYLYFAWQDTEGYIYEYQYIDLNNIGYFVAEGTDRWNTMSAQAPKITDVKIGGVSLSTLTEMPQSGAITFTAEAGAQCAKFWVNVNNPDNLYFNSGYQSVYTARLVDGSESGNTDEYTAAGTDLAYSVEYQPSNSTLYLIWEDTDGYRYEYQAIDLASFLAQ